MRKIKLKKTILHQINRSKLLSKLLQIYQCARRSSSPTFAGWGMITETRTPWDCGGGDRITKTFFNIDNELKNLIKDNKFILSQFKGCDVTDTLKALAWRHYIVYWSSVYAIKSTNLTKKNLVECGVCDGLTSFFAIKAANSLNIPYKVYLYDAWEAMREDLLLESEKGTVGNYSYLNIDATKRNLSIFDNSLLVFNKGYIPESFSNAQNPDSLVWLHIDLNSSIPTINALDFFWDKLEDGGVVLFDDYAHSSYENTQKAIQAWSLDKNGTLFHLPTGQGMFIKAKG